MLLISGNLLAKTTRPRSARPTGVSRGVPEGRFDQPSVQLGLIDQSVTVTARAMRRRCIFQHVCTGGVHRGCAVYARLLSCQAGARTNIKHSHRALEQQCHRSPAGLPRFLAG